MIVSNEKDIAEVFNSFFLETNLGGKTIEDMSSKHLKNKGSC